MTADNKLNFKEIMDSDIVHDFFTFLEFALSSFTLSWSKRQSAKMAQLELVDNWVSDSLSCCRTESDSCYVPFHVKSVLDLCMQKYKGQTESAFPTRSSC